MALPPLPPPGKRLGIPAGDAGARPGLAIGTESAERRHSRWRQRPSTRGQRSANGQKFAAVSAGDGTMPGIVGSRSRRLASRGIEAISPAA